ncbi:microsomal glutathione S-transferase 1-like [Chrysoperla carnea]|uniref:microsomal glutathione S-transferase 1-like n=1 Tax=Chrysoperla carnea TaxID=189513 RepID=UPI001D065842|nr:microsomal glutathione S-transferase 1-like [Chrysoperla carnea]XP_044727813.1 microsomal glutathione S-transferase 1-like [Chrysoperla carnea]
MSTITSLLSLDNPVFTAYVFYACVLVLKTLFMVALIGRYRWTKLIFISPEDAKFTTNATCANDDPDIERCRRAHLNDLENIPAFLFVALFYVLTDPKDFIALNLFRLFTLARFIHTFVYAVIVVPQPARVISWAIGFIITIYISVATAIYFF